MHHHKLNPSGVTRQLVSAHFIVVRGISAPPSIPNYRGSQSEIIKSTRLGIPEDIGNPSQRLPKNHLTPSISPIT